VPEGLFILVAGGLLAGTLVAAVVADTLRLPALVLFLVIGMAAGSDGAGWIRFDDYELARQIGTLALSLILFEGGLSMTVDELRPVLRPALGLAIVGTIVTAVLTGVAAGVLLGLAPLSALLLGAILASTDGAAVFAMLRGSRLRRRVVATLEGEAGLNDPIAMLLVVGFTSWSQDPGYGLADMAVLFVTQLVVGAVAGIAVGRLGGQVMRRLPLPNAGLYPVATIAIAAIAYGAAITLGGSGFLAVYLAGLTLSSGALPARMTVTIFHQGVAWLSQVALFLTLGLLVFPAALPTVWSQGTLLTLFLVFVARPVAVAVATALDRFTPAERMLLSWAGLRGGVPVVLATLPVVAHVPGSLKFFDVVFFVVVISTLAQGMTFEPLARSLGLLAGSEDPAVAAPALQHGAWSGALGDPAHPVRLAGAAVVAHLRTRRDTAGALVALSDGRHAITGPTLTVGSMGQLRRYAEERLVRSGDEAERAWWRDLATLLRRPGDERP
jgi:cell volume regulation protein A